MLVLATDSKELKMINYVRTYTNLVAAMVKISSYTESNTWK